jgi:GR25 family glycosyltransferase involved in LPS biosynthesis
MVRLKEKKLADIGFYINLEKRKDRKDNIESQFKKLNLTGVNRFNAITNLESPQLNCHKSHYVIYEEFLKTDKEILLVLEDDCLFLDVLYNESDKIIDDIYSVDWDIFWLGCKNRKPPVENKNNTYFTTSVSATQSYLIKRNLCEYLLKTYPIEDLYNTSIDELLCLSVYGLDVVNNPNKYNFYDLENPYLTLQRKFIALCYDEALTTQYHSYSDLWNNDNNYEEYITQGYPNKRKKL